MDCPFHLPTEFIAIPRFKRKTKNLDRRTESQLITVLNQFLIGNPQEKYKPQKIKGYQNLYRITLDNHRVLYELRTENGTHKGILRDFIPRNNEYRELRNF